jgi:hypothetical protein
VRTIDGDFVDNLVLAANVHPGDHEEDSFIVCLEIFVLHLNRRASVEHRVPCKEYLLSSKKDLHP